MYFSCYSLPVSSTSCICQPNCSFSHPCQNTVESPNLDDQILKCLYHLKSPPKNIHVLSCIHIIEMLKSWCRIKKSSPSHPKSPSEASLPVRSPAAPQGFPPPVAHWPRRCHACHWRSSFEGPPADAGKTWSPWRSTVDVVESWDSTVPGKKLGCTGDQCIGWGEISSEQLICICIYI